jgi:hypothetical protein
MCLKGPARRLDVFVEHNFAFDVTVESPLGPRRAFHARAFGAMAKAELPRSSKRGNALRLARV